MKRKYWIVILMALIVALISAVYRIVAKPKVTKHELTYLAAVAGRKYHITKDISNESQKPKVYVEIAEPGDTPGSFRTMIIGQGKENEDGTVGWEVVLVCGVAPRIGCMSALETSEAELTERGVNLAKVKLALLNAKRQYAQPQFAAI